MGLNALYGTAPKSAGGFVPLATVPALSGGGSTSGGTQPSPGRFSFDFTDPVKTVVQDVGEAWRVAQNIPGAKEFGGIAQSVFSGIGDVGIPGFQVKDLNIAGNVGSALGAVFGAINAPSQYDEQNTALMRLQSYKSGGDPYLTGFDLGKFIGNLGNLGKPIDRSQFVDLPADIRQRVDAGEDINALAQEMAQSGRGYSDNLTTNLAAAITRDPLNIVTFGAGAIKDAAQAVKYGAEVGDATRLVGTAYNGLASGGSRAVQAVVRGTIGPATSGIVRAYGAQKYAGVLKSAADESPALRSALEDYLAVNHTQMVRAVIGKVFGKQWDALSRGTISPSQIEEGISRLVTDLPKSKLGARMLEADAEALAREVKPAFVGVSDADLSEQTIRRIMATLDVPAEVAARIAGKVDRKTAAIWHGALYGRAVKDFVRLRDEILPFSRSASKAVQLDRITPIASDTLTDKRVADILNDAVTPGAATPKTTTRGGVQVAGQGTTTTETVDAAVIHDAIERYSQLRQKFLGVAYSPTSVVAYLRKLQETGSLVEELTSGVPAALRTWASDYGEFGYSVGYAPKSGWKAIIDDAGEVEVTDPFVHVQSVGTPTNIRNPIGRLGDSMFAAIHQRQLVLSSELRLADSMVAKGFGSEAQARGIHRAILREASERHITPRSMILEPATDPARYGSRLSEIFGQFLEPAEYKALIEKSSPEFEFLRAIEGNLAEVGWAQKLTGTAKSVETGKFRSRMATAISEKLYPAARFRYNPFFQAQERAETGIMKLMRGVTHQEMDPEVRDFIVQRFESDPDFRFLAEDYGSIFLHRGADAAGEAVERSGIRAKLAGLLDSTTDVAGTKRQAAIDQVFKEYAEPFAKTINEIDPRLWREMVESAGSEDARTVVEAWLKERRALTTGEGLEATLDAAKPEHIHITPADNLEGIRANGLSGRTYFWQGGDVNDEAMAIDLARHGRDRIDLSAAQRLGAEAERLQYEAGDASGAVAKAIEDALPALRTAGHHEDDLAALERIARERPWDATDQLARAVTRMTDADELLTDVGRWPSAEIGIRRGAIKNSLADPEFEGLSHDGIARFTDESIPASDLMVKQDGKWVPLAATPTFDADAETIWQALRYTLERQSQIARQTQYFREGRGFLERSLNHPFLGLYPLSYASKVFMEFGRFLLKRPFGLDAPLVGLAAMNKFQRALLSEDFADSELGKFVDEHPILLNIVNQMLPYWPTSVTVNTPLWFKDLAAQAEKGRGMSEAARRAKNANVTPGDAGKGIWDQSSLYLTSPIRLVKDVLGSLDEFNPGPSKQPQALENYRS